VTVTQQSVAAERSWIASLEPFSNNDRETICSPGEGAGAFTVVVPSLYSDSNSPEPPISAGKSFILGSPSLMRRTVSP
jgi:hypothetical protein